MADFTLETTATVPAGTTLTVTVYEDTDGDGTADNSASQAVDDGTNSYTLSGFDGSAGNEVWAEVETTSTDPEAAASLDSLTVSEDGGGGGGGATDDLTKPNLASQPISTFDYGPVEAPTTTRVTTIFDGFEDGDLSEWDQQEAGIFAFSDSDGRLPAIRTGTHALGDTQGTSVQYVLEGREFNGRITAVTGYYYETINTQGFAFELTDLADQRIAAWGTANPQWMVLDGTTVTEENLSGYDRWVEFVVTVDYATDTYSVAFDDGQGNAKTYSDLAFENPGVEATRFQVVSAIDPNPLENRNDGSTDFDFAIDDLEWTIDRVSDGTPVATETLTPAGYDHDPSGEGGTSIGPYQEDFESYATGTVPTGWSVTGDGASGRSATVEDSSELGSKALFFVEDTGGSGSDIHATTQDYSPTGNHTISFKLYYADAYMNPFSAVRILNPDQDTSDPEHATWLVQYNNGDNVIEVYDGGVWTAHPEPWAGFGLYDTTVDVDYDNDEFTVTINGTEGGPYAFRQATGNPLDYSHLVIRASNAEAYVDDFGGGSVDYPEPHTAATQLIDTFGWVYDRKLQLAQLGVTASGLTHIGQPVLTSPITDPYAEDFEGVSIGSLPGDWQVKGASGSQTAEVATHPATGSNAVRLWDDDFSNDSFAAGSTGYNPDGNHTIEFDFYLASADSSDARASFAGAQSVENSFVPTLPTWYIWFDHEDGRERILGVSDGGGVFLLNELEYDKTYSFSIDVDYDNSEWTCTVNGNTTGPHKFYYYSSETYTPDDTNAFSFWNDDFDCYLDNFSGGVTTTSLDPVLASETLSPTNVGTLAPRPPPVLDYQLHTLVRLNANNPPTRLFPTDSTVAPLSTTTAALADNTIQASPSPALAPETFDFETLFRFPNEYVEAFATPTLVALVPLEDTYVVGSAAHAPFSGPVATTLFVVADQPITASGYDYEMLVATLSQIAYTLSGNATTPVTVYPVGAQTAAPSGGPARQETVYAEGTTTAALTGTPIAPVTLYSLIDQPIDTFSLGVATIGGGVSFGLDLRTGREAESIRFRRFGPANRFGDD